MDTRFWGPSGWKLLHLISLDDSCALEERAWGIARFLETIPYILPCKYCRASLSDYYRQHPYQIGGFTANGKGQLDPRLDLPKWMYTIHNCVNDKLRKQGLYKAPNPPYQKALTIYQDLKKSPWDQQLALIWDFLFAVGYHHPTEKALYAEPMPDCPKGARHCKDTLEKNKWNLLPLKERTRWFRRFWLHLPGAMPKEMRENWRRVEQTNPPTLVCRASTLAWLWRMRCGLDTSFHDPYTSICKRVATFSSDCGSKKKGITCRKSMGVKRKTCKKRK